MIKGYSPLPSLVMALTVIERTMDKFDSGAIEKGELGIGLRDLIWTTWAQTMRTMAPPEEGLYVVDKLREWEYGYLIPRSYTKMLAPEPTLEGTLLGERVFNLVENYGNNGIRMLFYVLDQARHGDRYWRGKLRLLAVAALNAERIIDQQTNIS